MHFCEYSNYRIAIRLDCGYGIYTKATVNVPEVFMDPDEVAVKDYAENEGMLDFLVQNGIVQAPHRFTESGYVTIPICRLTVASLQQIGALKAKAQEVRHGR